jgi:hypothetical protein
MNNNKYMKYILLHMITKIVKVYVYTKINMTLKTYNTTFKIVKVYMYRNIYMNC